MSFSKEQLNKLKKQNGGLNLTGPVAIFYFKNNISGKKIIVLGDNHNGLDGRCTTVNSLEITQYLTEVFKSELPIDLFIERDIPDKYSLKKGITYIAEKSAENSYISKVYNFGLKAYKTDETKRVHFTDVRDKLHGFHRFLNLSSIFKLLVSIKSFKDDADNNIANYIDDFINNYVSSCIFLFKKIKNNDFSPMTELPTMLLKELERTPSDIIEKIKPVILGYLANIIETSIPQDDSGLIITLDNLDKIFELYTIGMNTSAAIADLYTILRIMKSPERQNNILYVGAAHINDINDYLTVLGFEKVNHITSKEPEIRCVKNIQTFVSFFKS